MQVANNGARQFMPFDALKGFKEEVRKKERIKSERKELSEESLDALSYKFAQLKKGMNVLITYYLYDEYVKMEGTITEINTLERYIKIDKKIIFLENIQNIESKDIKSRDDYYFD